MKTGRRGAMLTGLAMALMASGVPSVAAAADYPNKPVTVVVGWSPGGATDLLARNIAVELGKQLGQAVVVENRPGANGTTGHSQAARAAADGHTLLMATNSTFAIARHLYRSLPFDHERDLAPVSLLATSPLIMAVKTGLQANDVADLVALARAKPDALNLASGGNGSTSHLAGELFMALTGTKMTHVPYKGGGPATLAVIGGEVDVAFLDLGVAMPFVAEKRLRPIGVTGEARSILLPDVPTVGEAGVAKFESTTAFALFAPKGTPKPIVERLSQAVQASLQVPALRDKLQRQGIVVIGSGPEELREYTTRESAKWGEIIRTRGITLQ